jgi:hypothetical protein
MLLGPAMRSFHAGLAELSKREPSFEYHYVTAHEMAELVHAAEDGVCEVPAEALARDGRTAPAGLLSAANAE